MELSLPLTLLVVKWFNWKVWIVKTNSQTWSHVFVDFVGDISNGIPYQDRRELENAFRVSYNDLNSFNNETCDIFFREVVNVSLESTEVVFNHRRLAELDCAASNLTLITLPSGDQACDDPNEAQGLEPWRPLPLVFRFRVTSRCRGCRRDAQLFDEGVQQCFELMKASKVVIDPKTR